MQTAFDYKTLVMKGSGMSLFKSKPWMAAALGLLSGPTLAAVVTCTVTPVNSIITEGQTLQLQADCNSDLTHINWEMDGVSVTGDVAGTFTSGVPIYYTTPVGLGGTNEFDFTVTGTPTVASGNTWGSSTTATVVVKPSSAVVAKAAGSATPTTQVNATCGTANGKAVTTMPTNGEQCTATNSKPALAISGPTSFTWSCISLTGGLEANCSAIRGYTVTATAGANGSVGPATQGVAAGTTAIVTATPTSGYSASMSGCGGTQSGNTFTTGPVSANCTVTATFTNAPVAGACGTAAGVTATSAPSANLCTTGSASAVSTATAAYSWSCAGTNGGATASCSAPHAFPVTATAGANGTISPASKEVVGNTTTTFTVTPSTGYAATVTGCGGSLSGNTYTTGAITAGCSVSATFAAQTASTTDPWIGKGLWVPPNTTGRVVADQSGSGITTSYVPGCLNGSMPTTTSGSGCGGLASYTGTIYGTTTSYTFSFGSGKILSLRYLSNSTAGSSVKYVTMASGDGGNVGQSVKVWLSTSPTATYDATATTCKSVSTTQPYVITGPGYCAITPNTKYYLHMSIDTACTTCRYKVNEGNSDFNN